MSQHTFLTTCNGQPVRVLLGWDRPLQYHFLVVEYTDRPGGDPACCDGEPFVYSNLDDPNAIGADLDYYVGILGSLGITVPQSMIDQVRLDGEFNRGNFVVEHVGEGRFTVLAGGNRC